MVILVHGRMRQMQDAGEFNEIGGVYLDRALEVSKALNKEQDDFKVTADKILKAEGLSTNFRRKIQRTMQKADNNELSGDDSSSKQILPDKYGYGLFDVIEPPYNLYALAKIYELSSANYAAINAKVANTVGLGYDLEPSPKLMELMEATANSEDLAKLRKNMQRAKNRTVDWIETRNDEETFTNVLMKVWTDVESTGNGYIEVGRKTTGEIGYVGHIPASTIRVRRLRDGFVQSVAGKYTFFRNFQDNAQNPVTSDTRPNELIHIKKYTPTNTYYGIPDIVPSKNAMAGSEFASRFNLEYFENKAVPRYIFWLKGAKMSSAAQDKLFEFFQGNLRGQNHRTVVIPLPGDTPDNKVEMKMEPIESGIQDSSFNNYRKGNRDEILMAHRVPISKVGSGENISLANARESDRTFKEQVTRPSQSALEKKINKIINEKTDAFRFKFNELTLTDEDTQSKIDERYLRMQVIVPNEVRSRMGLSSLPGGDQPVMLNAQARAEQTAEATGNRRRDQDRQSNQADLAGTGREPQGEGRQQQ